MNEIIKHYSKRPPNRGILENYDIEHWEENRNCGEDLKVYLKIEKNKFIDYSFDGDLSIITTACSSIFGESIIGLDIKEVFNFDYSYIVELIEMEVSPRRRRASVFALLATRNAIHKYLKDGKEDVFEDVGVES